MGYTTNGREAYTDLEQGSVGSSRSRLAKPGLGLKGGEVEAEYHLETFEPVRKERSGGDSGGGVAVAL